MLGILTGIVVLACTAYSYKHVVAQGKGTAVYGVSTPAVSTRVDQASCDAKGQRVFEELVLQSGGSGTHASHYNESLQRCLVLVVNTKTTKGMTTTSRTLVDAFTGIGYGYYAVRKGQDGRDPVAVPYICEVQKVESGKADYCGSEAEFQALIKPYMQR